MQVIYSTVTGTSGLFKRTPQKDQKKNEFFRFLFRGVSPPSACLLILYVDDELASRASAQRIKKSDGSWQ